MGLSVLIEAGRNSELDFARALRPLSLFGLLHGSHEWLEMFLLINSRTSSNPSYPPWIDILRLTLLAVSFLLLIGFGYYLITGKPTLKQTLTTYLMIVVIWLLGVLWISHNSIPGHERIVAVDVFTRYALAIPGSALTVWGLLVQRRRFFQDSMYNFGNDVTLAAIAFGIYGGIGQLFAQPSNIFPSYFINGEVFIRWFGFPVQVLRAAMACVTAVFIIRSLRAFEVDSQRKIENLREAQLAEHSRLESMRAEMLHRTVIAQEAERKRIASELHDETGQALTGLGLGLRGLSEIIPINPQKAVQQARQLQSLTTQSLYELQRLVSGLHPPQLDDLGLAAALRWYAGETTSRFGIKVDIVSQGQQVMIPNDMSIVLFRIVQEAITNVVRHANATRVTILLNYSEEEINLQIEDDGRGFHVVEALDKGSERPSWGLLGMKERATLIGGSCEILSEPSKGTIVIVNIPFER